MNTTRSFAILVPAVLALAVAALAAGNTPARAADPAADALGQCELPPQLRRLGQHATYMAAGRRIRTTFSDCKVRGGKFEGGDFGYAPAASGDYVAINIGGDKDTPACQKKGAVANLSRSGTLTVRKGPATTYAKVDALTNGRRV